MRQAIIYRLFFIILLSFGTWFQSVANPLPENLAFKLNTSTEPGFIVLQWDIAPQHYLYKTHFRIEPVGQSAVKLYTNKIKWPPAMTMSFAGLGDMQVYQGRITLKVPVQGQGPVTLKVGYQGCQDDFCYRPLSQTVTLDVKPHRLSFWQSVKLSFPSALSGGDIRISAEHIGLSLVVFFIFGLLLAFTPCVLPMLPIVLGIISGQKRPTRTRSFLLALMYVLGMAFSYALAGIAAALLGHSIQALLQEPVIIIVTSLIVALFALSLFGLYDLKLPSGLQTGVQRFLHQRQSGQLLSVFVIGVGSSLILSPCVSAPLATALVYISTTGQWWFGGMTLFVLALGMGVPMLAIGLLGAGVLPKAGAWMQSIKNLCGLLLLAVALWLLTRILTPAQSQIAWGILLLLVGLIGGLRLLPQKRPGFYRYLKLALLLLSLVSGLVLGIQGIRQAYLADKHEAQQNAFGFVKVLNASQLQGLLQRAKARQQPVLIDLYANWCVECHQLDALVFQNQTVIDQTQGWLKLQIDMTHNSPAVRELLTKLKLFAPPAVVLIDAHGQEYKRFQGVVAADVLLSHMAKIN